MGKQDEVIEKTANRGVHTSDSLLLPPPSSTISESDIDMLQRLQTENSHDADESVISIVDEQNFSNIESSNTDTTDCDLYKMKAGTRKGLKSHPSNIKFELVKRSVGRFYDKKPRKRQPQNQHHKCHCRFENERPSSLINVPSQTVQHNKAPEIVESFESSRDYQPRRFRSKVRNMFACFHRQNESNSNLLNDDDEENFDKTENAEVYYFDHGSPTSFKTTDCPPHLVSEIIAQRTMYHATKFWAEFFGSINIVVTFIITFFLQFYRFLLYSIVRTVIVGFLQITSDYLLKPLLAVIFNGFLQPQLIFTQNIFHSICSMFEPLTKLMGNVVKPFTECVRAFRIVEVKNLYKDQASNRYQTFQGQNSV